MERNKSKKLKEKKYLDRFIRLNVYSHMRDNRPYLRIKPEELHEVFKGNASSNDGHLIDQSALQYYMILGLQDFYQNHFVPLRDENITLKEEVNKTQTMLINLKKKNDERFDIIMNHLMLITERINKKNTGKE